MSNTPPVKPLVVGVTQCAAMLGLSRAKIYLLVHEEILPLLKVGGTSKIPVAAIEEYVANCPVGVGEFPKKKSAAPPPIADSPVSGPAAGHLNEAPPRAEQPQQYADIAASSL